MKEDILHIRVDPETCRKAESILAELSMSIGEAINIFLSQVIIQEGLPFLVTAAHPLSETDANSGMGNYCKSNKSLCEVMLAIPASEIEVEHSQEKSPIRGEPTAAIRRLRQGYHLGNQPLSREQTHATDTDRDTRHA